MVPPDALKSVHPQVKMLGGRRLSSSHAASACMHSCCPQALSFGRALAQSACCHWLCARVVFCRLLLVLLPGRVVSWCVQSAAPPPLPGWGPASNRQPLPCLDSTPCNLTGWAHQGKTRVRCLDVCVCVSTSVCASCCCVGARWLPAAVGHALLACLLGHPWAGWG